MKKTFILILLLFLAFSILTFSITKTIINKRDLPSLHTTKKDLAVRGNIYSADNFTIATSRKIYSASIDTRCLDPNKKDLFVTLFSIYSNIPKDKILSRIDKKKGYTVISRTIDQRAAKELKSLAYKLRRLNVFRSIKINGRTRLYGLSIFETGEERVYPYDDALSPIIGFVRKNLSGGKQKVNGVNGIEKKFNQPLNDMQDGVLSGEKDILSYILFNKESKIQKRIDGKNIHLTIPLKLQRNIELMTDSYKEKLEAKEIIVAVMESKTGKIISLVSSNRYNPSAITDSDIKNLNINAVEYNFEPGSVIKPISISLALEHHKVKPNELFYAYNKGKRDKNGEFKQGKYKIGRFTIRDDHHFKKNYITLDDIVMFSSNIGTLIIANRLSANQFYDGFKKFGLSQKTNIDLPYESKGIIHRLYQFRAGEKDGKDNVYKATDSYGQGITTTFMQVLKAYSVFNNNGNMVTPYLVQNTYRYNPKKVISSKVANKMKQLLIQTVQKGTGVKARIEGIEVGGKTGTAQIARGGSYKKRYISSFFGFANSNGKKYTIAVKVREPIAFGKHWYYRYASNSAVPVFKETVNILVKLNYL
jgi:cell division protein FtsI (penicillin-binding protein 3)